jgi:UDP-glucose 4-epimerase
MRLLVTGASGRLGRTLRARIDGGSDVESIQTNYWISPRVVESFGAGAVVDLTDLAALDREVRDFAPDTVVHLAAITAGACEQDADLTKRVNVDATEVIAKAAAKSGPTRFVFASSSAIYGDKYDAPIAEDGTLNLASAYANSKYEAERVLSELAADQPSFSCMALRIFNIYGPEFTDSLVSLLRVSTPQSPVSLRGPDNFVRDYIHVEDVVDAIQAALAADLDGGFTPINVGSGVPTSNRDLVRALELSSPVYYEASDGPTSYSCASITFAAALLGLSPRPLR